MNNAVGQPVQWPADNVQRVPVSRLAPYAKNAKKHSRAQVAQIAALISELGWTTPILVDERGEIIAGHGRVLAAEQLGIHEVPTMVALGWTEAQIKAYRLADNALNQAGGGWDETLLKVEIKEVEALNFDVAKIGFDIEMLTKLFDDGGVDIQADRDEAGTGVRSQHLKFGSNNVIISDDELAGLNDLLARYTTQYGLSHGFAQWLIDAAT
jgi:hypothetical protein